MTRLGRSAKRLILMLIPPSPQATKSITSNRRKFAGATAVTAAGAAVTGAGIAATGAGAAVIGDGADATGAGVAAGIAGIGAAATGNRGIIKFGWSKVTLVSP